MTNWTDHDISTLIQRIDDLVEQAGILASEVPGYHEWQFDHGIWKCRHCAATRVCQGQG